MLRLSSVLGLETAQPSTPGFQASRWFLGDGNGNFSDPGVANFIATPFGWGTSIFDYDNDGDPDIVFHGGLDTNVATIADNPGVLFQNQGCSSNYILDQEAFPTVDHTRRSVRAVATGDLNQDGFVDIVTVANFVIPPEVPLLLSPAQFGSVFDSTAFFTSLWDPVLIWNGTDFNPGTLAVEINSGDNGDRSVSVNLVGSVSITDDGKVNRDGIGAVVIFTPSGGLPAMLPVQAGSSHNSQNSLELVFGLGVEESGELEVLWPGSIIRNKLYDVRAGERIIMPEIPCGYDADWDSEAQYLTCVENALNNLELAGIIDSEFKQRLIDSALLAFNGQQSGGQQSGGGCALASSSPQLGNVTLNYLIIIALGFAAVLRWLRKGIKSSV